MTVYKGNYEIKQINKGGYPIQAMYWGSKPVFQSWLNPIKKIIDIKGYNYQYHTNWDYISKSDAYTWSSNALTSSTISIEGYPNDMYKSYTSDNEISDRIQTPLVLNESGDFTLIYKYRLTNNNDKRFWCINNGSYSFGIVGAYLNGSTMQLYAWGSTSTWSSIATVPALNNVNYVMSFKYVYATNTTTITIYDADDNYAIKGTYTNNRSANKTSVNYFLSNPDSNVFVYNDVKELGDRAKGQDQYYIMYADSALSDEDIMKCIQYEEKLKPKYSQVLERWTHKDPTIFENVWNEYCTSYYIDVFEKSYDGGKTWIIPLPEQTQNTDIVYKECDSRFTDEESNPCVCGSLPSDTILYVNSKTFDVATQTMPNIAPNANESLGGFIRTYRTGANNTMFEVDTDKSLITKPGIWMIHSNQNIYYDYDLRNGFINEYTLIYKVKHSDSYDSYSSSYGMDASIIANRRTNYNFMFREYKNTYNPSRFWLHTTTTSMGSFYANSKNEPQIIVFRGNTVNGQTTLMDYAEPSNIKSTTLTYSKSGGGITLFNGEYNNTYNDIWVGNFYWLILIPRQITDDEIEQIINYDELL
jgi:hypothetical protein